MTLDNMTGITEGSYTGFCKSQLITCNFVKECNGVCPFEDALKHADQMQTMNDQHNVDHDRDWIIGCIEHDGFIKTDRFDKANQIIHDALSAEDVPQSEQYKKGFEDAKRAFLVEYARESENMRKRIAKLEIMLNAQKAISADRPSGEWIPVSERLPSEDGKYIVYYSGEIIDEFIDVMWYAEPLMPNVDVKGKHFYQSDSEWGDIIYDEVLAWMPLPKPYKGEAEE